MLAHPHLRSPKLSFPLGSDSVVEFVQSMASHTLKTTVGQKLIIGQDFKAWKSFFLFLSGIQHQHQQQRLASRKSSQVFKTSRLGIQGGSKRSGVFCSPEIMAEEPRKL
jgi:hypothetical protein